MLVVKYVMLMVALVVTCAIFGWFAPALVSAPSTPSVALGFALIFILYPAFCAVWWRSWKSLNNKKETK